jgi:hypothetical protein
VGGPSVVALAVVAAAPPVAVAAAAPVALVSATSNTAAAARVARDRRSPRLRRRAIGMGFI